MEPLADSLRKRMHRVGLESALSASFILETARRVLPTDCNPKSIHNGVMWIEAPTGADAYFYKQEAENFVERINAALGKKVVEVVKVRIRH